MRINVNGIFGNVLELGEEDVTQCPYHIWCTKSETCARKMSTETAIAIMTRQMLLAPVEFYTSVPQCIDIKPSCLRDKEYKHEF